MGNVDGKWYDIPGERGVDQILVPHGYWVLEACSYAGGGAVKFRVLGRDAELVKWHRLNSYGYGKRWLLVCPRVFGIESYLPGAEGRWFVPARQVHKGELGRTVPIALGALSGPSLVVKESKARYAHRHSSGRHKNGWMQLAEVAKAAEMAPRDLIIRYLPYTDTDQPSLQTVITPNHEHIRGMVLKDADWRTDDILAHAHGDYEDAPRIWGVQSQQLDRLELVLDRVGPYVVWIRQGFGNAVLRMVAIGHRPELERTANTEPAVGFIGG